MRDVTSLKELRNIKMKNKLLELLTSTVSHEVMQPLDSVISISH